MFFEEVPIAYYRCRVDGKKISRRDFNLSRCLLAFQDI